INNKVVMVYDGGGVGGKFSDIVALYNYGSSTTKYHFFESSGSSFSYSHVDFCSMAPVQTGTQILEGNESNFASNEEISGGGTKLYPNPSEGELNIEFSVN